MVIIEGRVPIYVYAENPESDVIDQVERIKNLPFFRKQIVIMPDCHVGKGCVIGFTGYFDDVVVPNIVGVDIGCGVYTYFLGRIKKINLSKLDAFIKGKIPLGLTSRTKKDAKTLPLLRDEILFLKELERILIKKFGVNINDPVLQIGTLGSGNHFIEIGIDEDGNYYLTVHTGSRNLGLKVCNHFYRKAVDYSQKVMPQLPKDLSFLPMEKGGKDYIEGMKLAQKYADINRKVILRIIVEQFFRQEFSEEKIIKSVHNYIDVDRDFCVRKGAISAHKDEMVVIPFNLVDGLIIGRGKGVEKLNFSAPHGAGRKLSRKKAKETISVKEFSKVVKSAGVFSSTISSRTVDEAPMAYKNKDEILKFLPETVEIERFVKPIYNIKG
ncbi:RtcB family protein [Desulfurobacterium atlanticum]|uniref:3'-phosphate/5'-hydroxy nucleic acid ligase n=1 Tax=Desulfurobacterium atlanticum TaxID=240169 RepID=A0A238YQ05_9BACT|nr:RtcB family protein [Desulfurobacterium atlanticum]SNR72673.1 tRNA-splicing ligase RtcB [Desulfurobacterium atlanticum]